MGLDLEDLIQPRPKGCRVTRCRNAPMRPWLHLCDQHFAQFDAESEMKWGYPPERPFADCWCCARTYKGNEPGHCEMCHNGKSHF